MTEKIIFLIQHGPFAADEQNCSAVVQHPHLVGGQQFASRLLIVDAEAAVPSPAAPIGVNIQCFLSHKLGDIFVRFFLIPPEVKKFIAQPHQRFPLFFE